MVDYKLRVGEELLPHVKEFLGSRVREKWSRRLVTPAVGWTIHQSIIVTKELRSSLSTLCLIVVEGVMNILCLPPFLNLGANSKT